MAPAPPQTAHAVVLAGTDGAIVVVTVAGIAVIVDDGVPSRSMTAVDKNNVYT